MSVVGGWLVTMERRRFSVWCSRGMRFTLIDGDAVPHGASYEALSAPTAVLMTIGGLEVERRSQPGAYLIKSLNLAVNEGSPRS